MLARRWVVSAGVGVLAAAIVAPWITRSGLLKRERPVAPVHETPEEVPGWSGEVELPDGSHVIARVARLHADARRQQFDALALSAHFHPAVADGEPFLCQLTRRAAATPKAQSSSADAATFGLSALSVVDGEGTALASFSAAPEPAEGELVDPLATLVAPPVEPLGPGRSVNVLVFGRAPRAGARLILADGTSVALEPKNLLTRELDGALARIAGKNTASRGVDGARR